MVVYLSNERLHRIRQWHIAHRAEHPLEYHLWDAVLTLWVLGCTGWLPAYVFHAWWAVPLLALGLLTPGGYVGWRAHAHALRRIRCEWLPAAGLKG